MSDVLPPVISSDHATSGEKKQKMNNQCTMLEDQDPHRGSFFKEYTLVIGAIAVLIEAVKYLKKNYKSWFEHV
ncbi:MAG: hypothetical protein EOO85_22830 [Pedobacter sp.]|nr:MAG: hypothetical protein EOO85_22830 [Pedobacter sp.]